MRNKMNQLLSLKKIEQKLYLKYLDDGLIEIIYGLIILLFGIGMITDTAWLGGVFGATIISLWFPLKKKITEPRMGQVKFSFVRRKEIKKQYIMFVALGIFTFIGGVGIFIIYKGVSNGIPNILKLLPLLPLGIVFSLPPLFIGILNKIIRYYLYGITIIVIFVLGGLLKMDPTYYVMCSGSIILIAGIWLLKNFSRQYSIVNEEK